MGYSLCYNNYYYNCRTFKYRLIFKKNFLKLLTNDQKCVIIITPREREENKMNTIKTTTLRKLRAMKELDIAIDITNYGFDKCNELRQKEEGFELLEIATGIYGVNGKLLKGRKTGEYYVITKRTLAIYTV